MGSLLSQNRVPNHSNSGHPLYVYVYLDNLTPGIHFNTVALLTETGEEIGEEIFTERLWVFKMSKIGLIYVTGPLMEAVNNSAGLRWRNNNRNIISK